MEERKKILNMIMGFGQSSDPGQYYIFNNIIIGHIKNGDGENDDLLVLGTKYENSEANEFRILAYGKSLVEMFLDGFIFLLNEIRFSVRSEDVYHDYSDDFSLIKMIDILTKKVENLPYRENIPHFWHQDME